MNIILTNAFSINMLGGDAQLSFEKISDPASLILENWLTANAIGHKETDAVVRAALESDGVHGLPVGTRQTVAFGRGHDAMLVAQYRGVRLPEGATILPEGAEIEWWLVRHHS